MTDNTKLSAELHNEIMRLPCKPPSYPNLWGTNAYKDGHRDARHAAAELASAAASRATDAPAHPIAADVEAAIVGLVAALQASKGWMRDYADAIVRDAIDRAPPSEQKPVAWSTPNEYGPEPATTSIPFAAEMWRAERRQVTELFAGPVATPAASPVASEEVNDMRITLVVQLNNLIDVAERYARRMIGVDPDEREYVAGAIRHARKVMEPYHYNGPLRAAHAGAPVTSEKPDPRIEVMAKMIYESFDGADAHPWKPGGNSFKQDDARRLARAALAKMEGE